MKCINRAALLWRKRAVNRAKICTTKERSLDINVSIFVLLTMWCAGVPIMTANGKSRMKNSLLILIFIAAGCNQCSFGQSSTKKEAENAPYVPGIVYSNPRVYNMDYCFEMFPESNKIDRAKDLKIWLPIPREWESQKSVKIISVQPEPHGRYVDPDYGNPMLFWDFGKEPEQPSYKVDIKFRLEAYKIDVEVDPNQVGSYDKTSKEYALYTRSTRTIHITPKIEELAQEAIGDETNPYLQANRIAEFARRKIHYKILDYKRGRGIDCLLAYPILDEETGEEYYQGACNQKSTLMVTLCRAVGIPARCVSVHLGWAPWIKRDDVTGSYPFEASLSPEGLAATQLFGWLGSHMSCEFFIPNYGWIPADPTWSTIGHHSYASWVIFKGRDIQIGPYIPPENNSGYGVNWVALHNDRADGLNYGVLNIAKIHTSKVTITHYSDPFPADGLAGYLENLPRSEGAEEVLRTWRQKALRWTSCLARSSSSDALNAEQFYTDYPQAKEERDAFVCHMLRRRLGDEKFFKLAETYANLRQKSGQAVPIGRFQELAEDVSGQSLDQFFNQWVSHMNVPKLKLENVTMRKDTEGWQVQGHLLQSGETTFSLPIELALYTDNGREMQKIWMDSKAVGFSFHSPNEPRRIVVDPDCEVLKAQRMAPHIRRFQDMYPKIIIVYGTLGEAEANKAAAERFDSFYFRAGSKIMKADTDVNDADLKTKSVVLIGRPETNKITQQLDYLFPVKFKKNTFTWQGKTFAQATQGITQVVENPGNIAGLIIMHAGLSAEVTRESVYWHLYGWDNSYTIFDRDGQLFAGDWDLEDDTPGFIEWSHKVSTGVSLCHAAWSGDLPNVKRLIQQGSDADMKESGWAPLHWAVRGQQKEVAEFLIAEGANVNTKGKYGRTPLYLAAREGYREIVELLLENGADVNIGETYSNRTAAESAMSGNHNEIIELLVSKGADISPLHLAIHLKDEAKARKLIENGVDVNKRTPYGTSPLQRAVDADFRDIVELLIAKGADVNAKDNWDWTALHGAIYSSKDTAEIKAMAELLIIRGANVNARDGDNRTPLWYAQKEGYSEIVELLRKHGAKE
jgi:ankyrin repeat protein/transglutaminase-like putative cysteine protease